MESEFTSHVNIVWVNEFPPLKHLFGQKWAQLWTEHIQLKQGWIFRSCCTCHPCDDDHGQDRRWGHIPFGCPADPRCLLSISCGLGAWWGCSWAHPPCMLLEFYKCVSPLSGNAVAPWGPHISCSGTKCPFSIEVFPKAWGVMGTHTRKEWGWRGFSPCHEPLALCRLTLTYGLFFPSEL